MMDSGGISEDCRGRGAPANLYAILGVDIKSSQDSIRRQYLKLARRWHPDRHQGSIDAKRKFQEISAAFGVLSCERQRSQYDLGLLDLLDYEDYLQRFQGLILTACGLGMGSSSSGASGSDGCDDEACEEEAVTSMSSCAHHGRRASSRRCLLTAR